MIESQRSYTANSKVFQTGFRAARRARQPEALTRRTAHRGILSMSLSARAQLGPVRRWRRQPSRRRSRRATSPARNDPFLRQEDRERRHLGSGDELRRLDRARAGTRALYHPACWRRPADAVCGSRPISMAETASPRRNRRTGERLVGRRRALRLPERAADARSNGPSGTTILGAQAHRPRRRPQPTGSTTAAQTVQGPRSTATPRWPPPWINIKRLLARYREPPTAPFVVGHRGRDGRERPPRHPRPKIVADLSRKIGVTTKHPGDGTTTWRSTPIIRVNAVRGRPRVR